MFIFYDLWIIYGVSSAVVTVPVLTIFISIALQRTPLGSANCHFIHSVLDCKSSWTLEIWMVYYQIYCCFVDTLNRGPNMKHNRSNSSHFCSASLLCSPSLLQNIVFFSRPKYFPSWSTDKKLSFQILLTQNNPKTLQKNFRPSDGINLLPVLNPRSQNPSKSRYISFLAEKFPGKFYFITSEKKNYT